MPKLEPYTQNDITPSFKKWVSILRRAVVSVPEFQEGTGSPEGVVTAKRWTLYMDTAGSAPNVIFVKQSATGNTGWVAIG